jgi:hypothetical protein
MPIRPENRARYPKNWRQISEDIRAGRAQLVCECEGECGNPHALPGRCTARQGVPHPVTRSAVVLTVAHLDHTPENCDPDNLKAMCQRCHLSYDGKHHAANAARTRAERAVTGMDPMFGDGAA